MKLFAAIVIATATFLSTQAQAAEALAMQIAPLSSENLYAASGPEPTHGMLLMAGLVGFVLRRRR